MKTSQAAISNVLQLFKINKSLYSFCCSMFVSSVLIEMLVVDSVHFVADRGRQENCMKGKEK
jgi:hypothetical protein